MIFLIGQPINSNVNWVSKLFFYCPFNSIVVRRKFKLKFKKQECIRTLTLNKNHFLKIKGLNLLQMSTNILFNVTLHSPDELHLLPLSSLYQWLNRGIIIITTVGIILITTFTMYSHNVHSKLTSQLEEEKRTQEEETYKLSESVCIDFSSYTEPPSNGKEGTIATDDTLSTVQQPTTTGQQQHTRANSQTSSLTTTLPVQSSSSPSTISITTEIVPVEKRC